MMNLKLFVEPIHATNRGIMLPNVDDCIYSNKFNDVTVHYYVVMIRRIY